MRAALLAALLALGASEAKAQTPLRVAVVVRGDPAPALREAARELETELQARGVSVPSDPALRAALRGDPDPTEDDGYGRLRQLRRSLGHDDADARALARLGRVAGADALAVLAFESAAIRVEVFAVEAGAFFQGVRPVDDAAPFVARAAARARASAPPSASPTGSEGQSNSRSDGASPPSDEPGATGATAEETPTEAPPPPRRARRWFKRNWPYVVGAALLGGVVAAFVLQRRDGANDGAALLRFRPGPDAE